MTEEITGQRDFDSRLDMGDSLWLVVNVEIREASAGDIVFGSMDLGQVLAEPWTPGELDDWKRRWRQKIIDMLDDKLELEQYDGFIPPPSMNPWNGIGIPSMGAWEEMRRGEGATITACRLEINVREAGSQDPAHLRIRVAKGTSRGERYSGTPFGGIEVAMGGSPDDVDMVLLHGDLEPQDIGNGRIQTRALHEFGRYLGLRPGSRSTNDMMGGGDQIRPWHGWPWWRRLDLHIDTRGDLDDEREPRFASVFRLRLRATGERSAALESSYADNHDDNQEQAALQQRENASSDQIQSIIAGVGATVVIGVAAAMILIFALEADGHIDVLEWDP